MMSVLCHLVTQPVSEFKTDFRAEFLKNLGKSGTEQQRDISGQNVNGKMYKRDFLGQSLYYFCDVQNKQGSYPVLIHKLLSEFDSHPEGQW